MLKYRLLTAIVLIPIVIAALFLLSPANFGFVVIAVCALGAWEWAQFVGWHSQAKRIGLAVVFAAILLAMQFSISDINQFSTEPMILYGLWAGLIWWGIAIILVVTYPASAAWGNSVIIRLLFGVLTIIPFYCGMMVLRTVGYQSDTFFGAWWLLYVMLLVWGADSGAYAFGRTIGRNKMAPKVSPGKTWEGLVGGLITAGVISWLFSAFAPIPVMPDYLLVTSIIVVVVSVFGDLTESMFKRQSGIKDSSHLIPGHGGILDRIDSLTAAIPVFAGLNLLIFNGFGL
ncbi:phosphatidate cytidylyltransferase [Providencia huaxiensis]|uniref:Phosphatidate cytidylyltransferase n=1 Tax=Providencia huaxiensis TaxID=2027290 RepID=A0A345M1M9_9GAMM|nr:MULTISPECIES: phosphatidate cytidylyltransferase [Providencia]AXH64269.1 phosphatidate cytidylyltransferase [Providencia huaxiensis]MBN6359682.1 phosphatidate cytidylyltransferase [Providencia huaxiensis]MBQ0267730.1 phosphatidate cytidylyltransferase [Providencia huaxiensis]MBQ0534291.1 phosphatidate cytidylyltransferase [Providencia huaxiensis]MBQ0589000.1 phosphatidate cytidylyltransferase [Providencia huaxiensis]